MREIERMSCQRRLAALVPKPRREAVRQQAKERPSRMRVDLKARPMAQTMHQIVHNDPRTVGTRRPDRAHRLPKLSWNRLLRPGASGKVMLGLFFATLLTFVAVAFLVGHP
jgi:hypothetical protein